MQSVVGNPSSGKTLVIHRYLIGLSQSYDPSKIGKMWPGILGVYGFHYWLLVFLSRQIWSVQARCPGRWNGPTSVDPWCHWNTFPTGLFASFTLWYVVWEWYHWLGHQMGRCISLGVQCVWWVQFSYGSYLLWQDMSRETNPRHAHNTSWYSRLVLTHHTIYSVLMLVLLRQMPSQIQNPDESAQLM